MATSRSFGDRSVTVRSPIEISPAVTSSSPATNLRTVDFPHPDGPTSTMNSPSAISRESSSTATTSAPKTLVTPCRTIFAMSHPSWGRLRQAPIGQLPSNPPVRGRPAAQQIETQEGGPGHRRRGDLRDARPRGDGRESLADPLDERSAAILQLPTAQHHVDLLPREPQAPDRGSGDRNHLIRQSAYDGHAHQIAVPRGFEHERGELEDTGLVDPAGMEGREHLRRGPQAEVVWHEVLQDRSWAPTVPSPHGGPQRGCAHVIA